MVNEASISDRKSWIEVPRDNDFPIQNLPFGVIRLKNGKVRCATRIGNYAIDLFELATLGYLDNTGIDDLRVFKEPTLNRFIACGRPAWRAVRNRIAELFDIDNLQIQNNPEEKARIMHHILDVTVQMPVAIGDYTDFYSSREHATNVGIMFRDPANALLPNWKHLPVAYHGRSSSIVASPARIYRPSGQTKADNAESPTFGPSRQLDFELEMAFIIGKETQLGEQVTTADAEEYIFGIILFNDLSARDIQKWEYVPLGPFLSKNFGSVISCWIVTLDALEPFRVEGPEQDPPVLPYLAFSGRKNYDIQLEVLLQIGQENPSKISHSNHKYLYWNMAQQLAHHTVNGCNIRVGDLMASGTISGPDAGSFGSMLELAWKGTKPIQLKDGSKRTFVEDYDTIIIKGYCQKGKLRLGFGECITQILPVKE